MNNIVIITGNEMRHQFFAFQISQKLNVQAVFYEQKANVHNQMDFAEGNSIVEKHFKLRAASEEKYFSSAGELTGSLVYELPTGAVNNEKWTDLISQLDPEHILLFGSSLIKDPLLQKFNNRIINLHLGLSPYYRGSGTNFWPLVHYKPECVGATIHLAVKAIDGGDILQQVRPAMEMEDSIHDMGNKTILAATDVLPIIIKLYQQNKIQGIKQDIRSGIVCKRKDLTAEAISVMYDNFSGGMIRDYLLQKENRDNLYPIVDQVYERK